MAERTLLVLRSSEGAVMVTPAWDERSPAAAALPLDTGVPFSALEKALQLWVTHALAGGADRDWLAGFYRRLRLDGLSVDDVAAAVGKLRRLDHALARAIPDLDFALSAAGPASASHSRVVSVATTTSRTSAASPNDGDAASRGRVRRRAEEEPARRDDRRKTRRQTAAPAAAATGDVRSSAITSAPPAATAAAGKTRRKIEIIDSSKCLPVPPPRKAGGPSLRARRGLPELRSLQVFDDDDY